MAMQGTDTNNELANVDLTKVAALQQKRTLAFVNHFVITTVQFLNNFMKKCEFKLMDFERKLEKVEAAMVLLETRLSSIPEINTVQLEPKPDESKAINPSENAEQTSSENVKIPESKKDTDSPKGEPETENPVKIPPEYDRFVKMVQVGVPLQAVKLKASIEGLDPNVLEKILGK